MAELTLEVATPKGVVYTSSIEMLVVPTPLGETGILPGHIALSGLTEAGAVRVTRAGRVERFSADPGLLQVREGRLVRLVTTRWEPA